MLVWKQTLILCEYLTQHLARCTDSERCGDSILVNGKGYVRCPGVEFIMSLVPPAVLPVLMGQNLTDKGCLPVDNLLAQTTTPHNFGLVPPGMFSGCNATDEQHAEILVQPSKGWASLNFISAASLQEMVGKY